MSLCLSDNYASLSISNNHAFAHTPAADVDSVFPKRMPRFPLIMMCACMIYAGRFTAERQGNKPERIFSVWLGLCPGTGWLLSTCLTNPVPLQQISLLPVLAKIMRADLRASKGVCQHLGVCAGLDGGMREERMLWRLEIY